MTNTQIEHSGVCVGRILIVDRVRRAGQNDTLRVERELRNLLRAREHLGIDIELTETASDQVGVLRSTQK